jgi:hypothetical protein
VSRLGRSLTSGGARRRRLAAGLALVIVVAVVVGVVVSAGSSGSPNAASNPGKVSGAATVERRDLVQTDTQSGTLSYNHPQTVYDRLSGTITWLPSIGQEVKPGGTLFKISGEPVILMNGTTPAYRDLNAVDSAGPDILQLNRNLVNLGYNADGILVNDIWQPATTVGVEQLQASLGETETGSLALGKIVFLPGDQLISTMDATVGSTGGGSAAAATHASTPVPKASGEFVSLTTTRTTSPGESTTTPSTTTASTSTTPTTTKPKKAKMTKPASGQEPTRSGSSQTLAGLAAVLKAEAAALKAATAALKAAKISSSSRAQSSSSKTSSSSSKSSSSSSSSSGGSASAVLQTTSTRLIVTVDLSASSQSEAKVGENVTVQMPAGSTVNGKIIAVSSVAQSSTGSGSAAAGSGSSGAAGGSSGSSSTVPVTITLTGHHTGAGLDQAAVSVNFAQAKARNVLSVPVTALLATSGGAYAVQEVAAPHQLIAVTTGLFAAGYVQISGSGIYPGLQVTDSQG